MNLSQPIKILIAIVFVTLVLTFVPIIPLENNIVVEETKVAKAI
jgi:hypothetical protein